MGRKRAHRIPSRPEPADPGTPSRTHCGHTQAASSRAVDPDRTRAPLSRRGHATEGHLRPLPRTRGRSRLHTHFRRHDPIPGRTRLPQWLSRVRTDDLPAVHSFANSLQRDHAAVFAGLTLPRSNGPTEGAVNRIKMLKRRMYGRVKLDLLRHRILHTRWRRHQQSHIHASGDRAHRDVVRTQGPCPLGCGAVGDDRSPGLELHGSGAVRATAVAYLKTAAAATARSNRARPAHERSHRAVSSGILAETLLGLGAWTRRARPGTCSWTTTRTCAPDAPTPRSPSCAPGPVPTPASPPPPRSRTAAPPHTSAARDGRARRGTAIRRGRRTTGHPPEGGGLTGLSAPM
ncbi:ISL3 family transposase [Embleya hyalina]|uniref:ISL3 family transposase n=1 Tax=Embleya hyalina TaxID=516124 RepID=A0A401Z2G1_9ACTN|nr:ISL3 family transposase [Embleya hyalina]